MSKQFTDNAPGAQIDVMCPAVNLADLDIMFPRKTAVKPPAFYDRVGRKLEITGTGFAGSLPDDGMPPTVTITNGVVSAQYFHGDNVSAEALIKVRKSLDLAENKATKANIRADYWQSVVGKVIQNHHDEIQESLILRAAYWLYRKTSI